MAEERERTVLLLTPAEKTALRRAVDAYIFSLQKDIQALDESGDHESADVLADVLATARRLSMQIKEGR